MKWPQRLKEDTQLCVETRESVCDDGFLVVGQGPVARGLDVVLVGAAVLPGGAAQDGDQVQRARLLQLVGQLCRRVSLETGILVYTSVLNRSTY